MSLSKVCINNVILLNCSCHWWSVMLPYERTPAIGTTSEQLLWQNTVKPMLFLMLCVHRWYCMIDGKTHSQPWFCMVSAMVSIHNLNYMICMDSAKCRIHHFRHDSACWEQWLLAIISAIWYAWTVQIVGSTISAMVLHGQCKL